MSVTSFNSFIQQINEDAQLTNHEVVNYVSYVDMLEGLEQGVLNEFKLPSVLKKAKKFIDDVILKTGLRLNDIVTLFKEKIVYKLMNAINWSTQKMYDLVFKGFEIAQSLRTEIAHYLTAIGKDEATTFDKWINDKPIRKKLVGLGVASLLAYIWFNMTFTGDAEYDFNQSNLLNALNGNFSIEDLFTGEDGIKLLSLFTAGRTFGISFPWSGGATTQFTIAIIMTLSMAVLGKIHAKYKSKKIKKKVTESNMKHSKFTSLLAETVSQAITNAYEKSKVASSKICDKCGYEYPKYKGKYSQKCPQCEDGGTLAMRKAMMKTANAKATCSCGFVVPKYKGKYPKYCAMCGKNMIY